MAELTNLLKINDNGISIPSFREVREALVEKWQEVFEGINLSSDTPDGHHVDLEARAITLLLQSLQSVASNLLLSTSSGIFLDNIASLFGLHRNEDETDADLRLRLSSAHLGGYATFEGMLTYLKDNISPRVGLQVNDEPYEQEGLPGHSFNVFIPDDVEMLPAEIAMHIFTCKPAGIRSFGNNSAIIQDSTGERHEIFYSTNQKTSVILAVTITEYTEEVLPSDYEAAIKNEIVKWAEDEYTNGKDLIIQRLYSPVFNVPGILDITISATIDGVTKTSGSFSIPNGYYIDISPDDISVILDEGL